MSGEPSYTEKCLSLVSEVENLMTSDKEFLEGHSLDKAVLKSLREAAGTIKEAIELKNRYPRLYGFITSNYAKSSFYIEGIRLSKWRDMPAWSLLISPSSKLNTYRHYRSAIGMTIPQEKAELLEGLFDLDLGEIVTHLPLFKRGRKPGGKDWSWVTHVKDFERTLRGKDLNLFAMIAGIMEYILKDSHDVEL